MSTPQQIIEKVEHAAPGRRFQRLYDERQRSKNVRVKNWMFVAAGLIVIGAGVATYVIPVIPSEILFLIGIALLSQGSRRGARMLDHAELWARRRFAWLIEKWKPLPRWVKWTVYL